MISKCVVSRRSYVTLIELIIAAALTALVLTTLLFFYSQVGTIGRDLDKAKEENFKHRYAEARLSTVFPNIVSEKNNERDFVFFSFIDEGAGKGGSQNLIFTFDNDISLDKGFSNHVIGRLFVDSKGRLILAYWPSPKRWIEGKTPDMKQEVLLTDVEDVSFDFFVPPDRKKESDAVPQESPPKVRDNKKPRPKPLVNENAEAKEKEESSEKGGSAAEEGEVEPEPKGDWRRQPWLKQFNRLPAMVRVNVKFKDEKGNIHFVFPLSQSNVHPIYE